MISLFLFFIAFGLKMFKDIKTQTVTNPYLKCSVYMGICLLFGLLFGVESKSVDVSMSWFAAFFLELVLSFDNLAVILMIMASANLKDAEQKTVLNYGIFGAVIMRILMLSFGVSLFSNFSMVLFPAFGLYLGYVGYKMLKEGHETEEQEDIKPTSSGLNGLVDTIKQKLINFMSSNKAITALVPAVLIPIILQVEATDLLFAVDSIPAVLALTTSWPIVITSNLAAISFLRELYFVFADLQKKLHLLTTGVAYAIMVIALKMLVHPVLHMLHVELPVIISFLAVLSPIVISVIMSLLNPKEQPHG